MARTKGAKDKQPRKKQSATPKKEVKTNIKLKVKIATTANKTKKANMRLTANAKTTKRNKPTTTT